VRAFLWLDCFSGCLRIMNIVEFFFSRLIWDCTMRMFWFLVFDFGFVLCSLWGLGE